jgi:hypothetical protein
MSADTRVPASWILAAALVIHAIAFTVSAVRSSEPAGDFDRYFEIASAPGRPYVDYQVEHPIATLLVFRMLGQPPGTRSSFGLGIVLANLVADAIIIGSLLWGWGIAAAACGAAIVIPILDLLFNRVDAWSTAAAVLAVAAWRHDKPLALGCALAVGTAFKLWPLVLAPLIVVPWRDRQTPLALGAFAATAVALGGAALWIAGSKGILQVLTFRGATGWQIESLVGSVMHLTDSKTLRMESGAWRIGTINSRASIAMFVAAAPVCIWSSWRGARLNRVGAAWLGGLTTLLLLSALLSAQYVIWLAPAAAIAWTERNKPLVVLTAVAIAFTQWLWSDYGSVLAGERVAMLIVVLRNLVLVVLAVSAIRRVASDAI